MPNRPRTSQKRSPVLSRQQRSLRSGVTSSVRDYHYMCRHAPQRLGIIAEGDSWFSYPRSYLLAGPNINLLHHLRSVVSRSDAVNLLCLSRNGDEAAEMLAGRQKYRLAKVLEHNQAHIDIIFFSGGGNDLVGRYDMDRLLRDYKAGFTAVDCIEHAALERKLQRIELAFSELMELRNAYAPNAHVVTHTYDIVKPSAVGAELLKFYKVGPWIYPYLLQRGIPEYLHLPISRIMLEALASRLHALAESDLARKKFLVVDTQGTLRPGHGSDWLNEIHPSSSGSKRLFKVIYQQMRSRFPQLPR
ncbi:MAG: hypothetical protein AB8B48_06540 [Pseudomonadales bacterium]